MVDELSAIQELDQARVHGIILLNPTSPLARLQPLIHPTRPIVAIVNADWPSQPGFSCLGTNNIEDMRQALRHVLELQHTRMLTARELAERVCAALNPPYEEHLSLPKKVA